MTIIDFFLQQVYIISRWTKLITHFLNSETILNRDYSDLGSVVNSVLVLI